MKKESQKRETQNTSPVKKHLDKEGSTEIQENSNIYTYECIDAQEDMEQATVVLAERGERYVLLPEQKDTYVPIYMKEFPFFIGTLKTKVDYAINSRSVSRFHAKIEQENGQFFLVDLNSTNGTFVNGEKLKPNERHIIYQGDLISFAEIGYWFGKE